MLETAAVAIALTTASKIKEDSILGMLYKDSLQPSVQLIGKALGTAMEFCTTPLLLCKFGSEAAKLNYQRHLDNYAAKIKHIPESEAIDVNPQIGAPIMEKLTYTTNEDIADLFTSLLAKASSSVTINQAHPAYIQLIERLSVDEARILKTLVGVSFIPSINLKAYLIPEDRGFLEVLNNGTDIKADLMFPENMPTYLDNLKSLGLLDNTHGNYKTDETLYQPLFDKYGYDSMNEAYLKTGQYLKLEKTKSYFQVTDFGRSFINACLTDR